MKIRGTGRALLTGSVAATLLSKHQASADSWGGDAPGLRWADGSSHSYCRYQAGVSDGEFAYLQDAMAHLDEYTVMSANEMSECFSGVDVILYDSNLPNGVMGEIACVLSIGDDYCNTNQLEIDYAAHSTTEEIEQTACHELGHTVGLRHDTSSGYSSCMMSVQQDPGYHRIYTQHHKDHINAGYQ